MLSVTGWLSKRHVNQLPTEMSFFSVEHFLLFLSSFRVPPSWEGNLSNLFNSLQLRRTPAQREGWWRDDLAPLLWELKQSWLLTWADPTDFGMTVLAFKREWSLPRFLEAGVLTILLEPCGSRKEWGLFFLGQVWGYSPLLSASTEGALLVVGLYFSSFLLVSWIM